MTLSAAHLRKTQRLQRLFFRAKAQRLQNTAVALNAGAAIYAGELGITLKDAVKKAENIISSGEGYKILEGFVKVTNE